ncbi:MAG: aspartate--tRNA ligase [Candidatus Coatesbacteria bacterium]|nr:MAG: aspartate--tRNA ligase [Candidatus Coatesbacteria bacterium]
MLRDEACGNITSDDAGREVTLAGWVRRIRNLGGINFIDLWDRTGTVQIKFDPEVSAEVVKTAEKLHIEYVIQVKGRVQKRPKEAINPKVKTGEIEVSAEELRILAECKPLPFMIEDEDATEEMRLKYRYLDLRRPTMQRNIILRHRAIKAIRDYLDEVGFVEVETPILMKSTPEGARDYLVPSRIHKGKFYALPQSPQMYKQLLMIAGYERYFQIARCFRDEDLRADRQPEFTQLDIEMSFVNERDIMTLSEGLMGYVFEDTLDIKLNIPFERITYNEAIARYGTDKPDMRYGLELIDVTDIIAKGSADFIRKMKDEGAGFIAITHHRDKNPSRKELDEYERTAKDCGAGGLMQFYISPEGVKGALTRFYTDEQLKQLVEKTGSNDGDLIQIAGGEMPKILEVMGKYRSKLAQKMCLVDKSCEFKFVWITDFPLFELDEEGNITSTHHPFTSPVEEHIEMLETEPLSVVARSYDLVCNGYELGTGSIRISDSDLQRGILKLVGLSDEQIEDRFGFFLKALDYGCPPHGGIALGLDRIIMLMAGEESIRDVIAFPKTLRAVSLMSDEPSEVDEEQLKELGLIVVRDEDEE